MSFSTYVFFSCIIKKKDKKKMSKKSSKLNEISKMFNEIDIEFDELNNEGINDMIAIVKK